MLDFDFLSLGEELEIQLLKCLTTHFQLIIIRLYKGERLPSNVIQVIMQVKWECKTFIPDDIIKKIS